MVKRFSLALILLLFMAIPAYAQLSSRESTEARTNEFRTQIQNITDSRKSAVVQSISDKIADSNLRLITTMLDALDKLTIILDRVENNATMLNTSGLDTTTLLRSIVDAENAIEKAKEGLSEQIEKEYAADLSNEANLRTSIANMVSEYRADITAVFGLVSEAKESVQIAITEAKALSENPSRQATNSANINIE